MPINNKKIIQNTLFLTAAIAVIALVYNSFRMSNEYKNVKKELNDEVTILENQLDVIIYKYDSLKTENELLKDNYAVSVVNKEDSQEKLSEIITNVKEVKLSSNKVGSLKQENDVLNKQLNDIEKKIFNNSKKIKQIETSKVNEATLKQLTAVNINARGVRVLSDLYDKKKKSSIQELRVCFTLEGNEFVGEGNKKIFIQIINPNNQIVSIDRDSFSDDHGNSYMYSSKIDAFYNQKDTDVCAYVDLEKNKTIKGTYQVNLFYDAKKIGSTTYQYN